MNGSSSLFVHVGQQQLGLPLALVNTDRLPGSATVLVVCEAITPHCRVMCKQAGMANQKLAVQNRGSCGHTLLMQADTNQPQSGIGCSHWAQSSDYGTETQ